MISYYITLILLGIIVKINSEDICKIEKWWEVSNFNYYPEDFCLNVDMDYEIRRDVLSKICDSNLTEYRQFVKGDLDNINDYSFMFLYFTDINLDHLSCNNRTKKYILTTIIDNKLDEILPRKNKYIFDSFKFLNYLFEIPVLLYTCLKAFIFSGLSYVSFKKY